MDFSGDILLWFQENDDARWYRVAPYIAPTPSIALRTWDYFVCCYARVHRVECISVTGERVNIYHDMQSLLLGLNKMRCDPFRRKHRPFDDSFSFRGLTTTYAQLCFFKWALVKGAVDYLEENHEAVKQDMVQVLKRRAQTPVVNYLPSRRAIELESAGNECDKKILVKTFSDKVDLRTIKQKKRKRICDSVVDSCAQFSPSPLEVSCFFREKCIKTE